MTEDEFLEKMLGPKYKSAPLEKITSTMKAYKDLKNANPVNEAFDPPKVNREDDQTEPEEVYSTEALGPGQLALRYDNEGTPVYKKFEDRMEDMNGDDLTYKKLKGYGQKYLKHKYEAPDEYHYTPKVRVTDKSINETYVDVLEENIFKVKKEKNNPHTFVVKKFGKACSYPGTFNGSIHAIITSTNFKRAISKTIKAGGCNCSRANFVGAYFAALKGINGIPKEWISKTRPAKNILRYIS